MNLPAVMWKPPVSSRRCFRCECTLQGGYAPTSFGWTIVRLCLQCVMFLESGAPLRHPGRPA